MEYVVQSENGLFVGKTDMGMVADESQAKVFVNEWYAQRAIENVIYNYPSLNTQQFTIKQRK